MHIHVFLSKIREKWSEVNQSGANIVRIHVERKNAHTRVFVENPWKITRSEPNSSKCLQIASEYMWSIKCAFTSFWRKSVKNGQNSTKLEQMGENRFGIRVKRKNAHLRLSDENPWKMDRIDPNSSKWMRIGSECMWSEKMHIYVFLTRIREKWTELNQTRANAWK